MDSTNNLIIEDSVVTDVYFEDTKIIKIYIGDTLVYSK